MNRQSETDVAPKFGEVFAAGSLFLESWRCFFTRFGNSLAYSKEKNAITVILKLHNGVEFTPLKKQTQITRSPNLCSVLLVQEVKVLNGDWKKKKSIFSFIMKLLTGISWLTPKTRPPPHYLGKLVFGRLEPIKNQFFAVFQEKNAFSGKIFYVRKYSL